MIRRLVLFLAFACALSAAAGTASTPDLSADSTITVDYASGELVAKPNARLVDTDLLLTADEIRFNQTTRVAVAIGNVVLNRIGDRLLADRVTFNTLDGTFTATNLRGGRFPYYIEGPRAEGSRKEVVIHDATVIYREPSPFQPSIKARVLTYSPGHYLRVSGAEVGVGKYRPVPVMHIAEDLARQSSLWSVTADGGYRHSLGPYLDAGIHIPIAPGVSAGPDFGLYTFRGLMLGPIANYNVTDGDDSMQGFLKSGYIYDFGDNRMTDILDNPVPNNRAYIEWQHMQQVTPDLTLTGDINWSSDSEVVRDFHSKDFVPVQEPDNFLEAVYSGGDYLASVFTRFQPDAFYPVQQRLPEVRFDLLPTAIGSGLYIRFNSGLAHLEEVPPDGGSFLASDRLDAFLSVTRPFSYKGILDFTPVAGVRFTDYWDTVGAADPGGTSRTLGEVGFDADLKMSATWDYENPFWHIDGLRHLITPTLSYRYIPDANKSVDWIPPIDRSTFTNYLPILDLGDMRALDQLQAQNVVRLGLNNVLQTRDKAYGSMNLISLDLADDLNLHRTPGIPDFSDLFAQLTMTPARWLEVRVEDTVAANRLTERALDSTVTFKEGDLWSAGFGLGYLSDQFGNYTIPGLGSFPIEGLYIYHAEGRVRLNEVYDAFVRGDYDARDRVFVDQFYGISQRLANTWQVEYAIVFSNGPNKSTGGHFGLNVTLNLIRF